MKKALRWLELPIHVFMWIALFCSVLMMFHVSIDVAGRFFYRSLTGTNEIVSGYYMILIVYLPWAYVTRHDNHIAAEIFSRFVPAHISVWLEIGIKILTCAYVSLFTWETNVRAFQQMRAGESLQIASGYLAVWPSRFVLPVAGALMVLYLVIRILDDIAEAAGFRSGDAR